MCSPPQELKAGLSPHRHKSNARVWHCIPFDGVWHAEVGGAEYPIRHPPFFCNVTQDYTAAWAVGAHLQHAQCLRLPSAMRVVNQKQGQPQRGRVRCCARSRNTRTQPPRHSALGGVIAKSFASSAASSSHRASCSCRARAGRFAAPRLPTSLTLACSPHPPTMNFPEHLLAQVGVFDAIWLVPRAWSGVRPDAQGECAVQAR